MNNPDSKLLRLFSMARSAPGASAGPLPSRLQARVLAHWESPVSHLEVLHSLHVLFRRAVVCATVLMLASIVWSLSTGEPTSDDDLALANYELQTEMLP